MIESLTLQLTKMHQCKVNARLLPGEIKNGALALLSEKIKKQSREILTANQQDLIAYQNHPSYQKSFEDRLTLTESRIHSMAESLFSVMALKEPVGEVTEEKILPNGLKLKKVRAPLGLIFLIFESRPNVIIESFSLAFKAGNSLILKGGKESFQTSQVLYRLITESLQETQIPPEIFWGLENTSRAVTDFLIKQNQWIDILIPRGGDSLIEYVTQHSRIPMIKNDRGLCHLYVHEKADPEMALSILVNAKTQRPGVCNSIETLLIDQGIAAEFLPKVYSELGKKGVEFFVCDKTYTISSVHESVFLATETSFKTEYLDLKLNIKLIPGVEAALEHIERFGSRHSEAIITSDETTARFFESRVDAAVVYWNASTRFTDGGQFGMGGEIGISTQKLQVRGPVGMESLTSQRWIVEGQGQVRNGP